MSRARIIVSAPRETTASSVVKCSGVSFLSLTLTS
nr:MAG TPA: hypothetical protein [Caudoviricetes sp.]